MADHPGDDLQRLLDGRLDERRRAEVEAHLAGCARCRRERDALLAVKSALRDLPGVAVPEAVAAHVRAAARGAVRPRIGFPVRRVAAAAAVLVLVASLAILARTDHGDQDIVRAAAADFLAYRAGNLRLEHATAVPADLERFFRTAGMSFWKVFDFSGMEFRLAGGGLLRNGRLRTLFAYEGPGGDRLICQMYLGTTADLPDASEVRTDGGVELLVYRVDQLTLVFWQEGEVVCVLVMDGDPERAIAFARAKAVNA